MSLAGSRDPRQQAPVATPAASSSTQAILNVSSPVPLPPSTPAPAPVPAPPLRDRLGSIPGSLSARISPRKSIEEGEITNVLGGAGRSPTQPRFPVGAGTNTLPPNPTNASSGHQEALVPGSQRSPPPAPRGMGAVMAFVRGASPTNSKGAGNVAQQQPARSLADRVGNLASGGSNVHHGLPLNPSLPAPPASASSATSASGSAPALGTTPQGTATTPRLPPAAPKAMRNAMSQDTINALNRGDGHGMGRGGGPQMGMGMGMGMGMSMGMGRGGVWRNYSTR
jgi:hypothetical protein